MNNYENRPAGTPSAVPLINRKPVEPLFKRKTSDIIAAAIIIVLSVFYVSAFVWNGLNLGYTVVFNCLLIFLTVFVFKKGAKVKISFLLSALLSSVCSFSLFITGSQTVKAAVFVLGLLSAVLWLSSAAGIEYKRDDLGIFFYPVSVIAAAFANIPATFKGLFSKGESKSKNAFNIFIGVACSVPALFIIVPLLLHSDEAFSSLLSGFFDDFSTVLFKTVTGLLVASFLIVFSFSVKYSTKEPETLNIKARVSPVTVCAFLSVISSVYAVYLFSQLAYFFSAFSSILPEGYKFTYAGYARRGFFELCVIAVINLAVIYAAILLSKKQDGKIPLAVKLPCSFIIVFTFVIIFTALSKMWMYIGAYGFTVLRVLTSAFMIWMVLLFIGIFIRLFVKRLDILASGLVFALVILAVLGLGNVNGRIADYNYNAYKNGTLKEIDVEYMGKLGADAVPYLYELTKNDAEKISNTAKAELSFIYETYYKLGNTNLDDIKSYKEFSKFERVYSGYESYSVPVERAYKILDKYAKEQDGKVYSDYYFSEDYESSDIDADPIEVLFDN